MQKNLIITSCLILLFNFLVSSQVSLVFPKDNYVFDQTSINFEWSVDASAIEYHIQIATDNSFSAPVINLSNIPLNNYLANNLTKNQQYYWRIKSNNSPWSNVYTFRIVDFSLMPEIEMWMKGDSVKIDQNGRVEKWYNLKNNSLKFSQSLPTSRPFIFYNNIDNRQEIEFNADDGLFLENVDLSHLSSGEIFSVLKLKSNQPSVNKSGIWKFGTHQYSNHYPYTNGQIYTCFGNTQRFNFSVPSNFDFTKYHIINIQSGGEFSFNLNQDEVFSSTSSSPAFNSNTLVGHSPDGTRFLDGYISEIILLNTVSNDSLNELINSYLRHKYAPPVNLGQNISQYGFCDTTLYAGKRFDSYLWSDGSTADSLIVSEPGTYWVETVDIFGFTSSDTIEVVFPEFQYPTSQLYCPSEFINWQTGLGEHYNYLWSDGSTADSLVINSPGDYYVTVTDTNGCVFKSDTLSFQEDVFPTSASLGPDLNLCSGNNLSLTSGASEAVSYLWNTGSTEASILIENSGTYSVEVININGCVAKDTVDVTIIGDAPVLAIDFPQYACLNTVFSFEDESSTVDGSILTSWTWEMGDGNTFTSPTATHSYNEGGSYEVNYAIGTSSGCFMDTTFTVEVRNNPILTLSSNGACQNSSIEFYGGQLTPFTISDWRWDFGDNTPQISGQNVTHEFTSHGEFEVLLIGTDNYGCIDTVSSAKFISPIPNVDFTYNEICEGKVVNFQNESSIASPSTISNYYWSFGDGNNSGQIHPQKPYITYGEYPVSLTAVSNDGCNASKDTILKVHAVPSVDYSIEQACAGLSTMLKDQSFVADGSVAQVDWSIQGAPAISGFSVEKTFDYVGTYHLKQTVKSAFGCSQTEESLFEIHEALKADFSFYPNAFIVNEPTVFINETVGGTDFHWTFGDFASAQQADTSIVFTEDQLGEEITVQLWAKNDNNCMDSVSVSKEVIGRETDLSVSEIFTQKEDGFLTIGVRLKNKGSTPIENVELTLQKSGNILLKEIWTGELQANEEEIYVFSAALSAFIAIEDSATQFICIRGRILNTSFPETDLSNNESCLHLGNPQNVIIQAFPNPARNQLKLRFLMPFEENASLMMYDSDGRLIQNIFEDKTLDEGLNTIELEVSHLVSGNYIILYRGENQVQSKRIIVVN